MRLVGKEEQKSRRMHEIDRKEERPKETMDKNEKEKGSENVSENGRETFTQLQRKHTRDIASQDVKSGNRIKIQRRE